MSTVRLFDDSDIKSGARFYDWKGKEGLGPDDDSDIGIAKSSGALSISLSGRSSLNRAEKLLAGIPVGFEKAIRSAAKRIEPEIKRSSTNAAAERYAVTPATIRKEEDVSVSYSFNQGAQVTITFAGYKIPLYRFSGAAPKNPAKDMSRRVGVMLGSSTDVGGEDIFKWRLVHPSIPAKGHALKATAPYQFQHAFVAHFKSGHTGIFEKTGGMTSRDKDEIEEIYGPSVPQMLGNDAVARKVVDDAMEAFDARMEHELFRIMNGWGG